ncbi:putative membrane protein [Kineococcus xinjiangensis]|uniref:Putative membrane protein n=1 Tax=Kineococcus xinjiangensis TaxID=512762 RepID=A0A2S6IG69_9ACTN|nr:YibE/F family protein [Kineococcus xinjiangensis]PPK93187.1 putative membrane protein [Kineococcus xinjiangensis]
MAAHPHGHTHDPAALRSVRAPRGVRWLLGVLVVLLLAAALAGVASTWPTGARPGAAPTATTFVGEEVVHGRVEGVRQDRCPGTSEDRLPDGEIPAVVDCPHAAVRLNDGPGAGSTVEVPVPALIARGGLERGDAVTLSLFPATAGQPAVYAWNDFDRRFPLALAVGLFAVLTVAVAGRRGVAALVGLGVGGAAVLGYVVPSLLEGNSPVVVALSASVAVMGVVLYTTHGVSTRTTAAYLGTVAGLGATALLAHAAVDATQLRGLDDEDSYTVSLLAGGVDLRGFVLAGVVIAALGSLNDVTITQASAVWEVRAHDPAARFATLLRSGMRVGRDHLASTVYTVAFAYAGAALPTLLLIELYERPLGQVLTSGAVAEEVVRTVVAGAALALAVPFTTALAAAAIGAGTRVEGTRVEGTRVDGAAAGPGEAPGAEGLS